MAVGCSDRNTWEDNECTSLVQKLGRVRRRPLKLSDAKFDQVDLQILSQLQRSCNVPIQELADQVKMSIASCSRRIKRMEEAGVIERYVAILNPAALGIDLDIFVSVRLNDQTRKTMDAFYKLVADMPEVVECYSITGDTDFMLHVRSVGVKEFATWMRSRLLTVATLFHTQSQVSLERLKYSTELPLSLESPSSKQYRK